MSKDQAPRALMKERLKAESEEELCLSKEEIQRKQQLPGSMLNPRVVLHRVRVHTSPGLIQDLIQDLKREILETSQIKEEPEEQSIKQLQMFVPESSPSQIKEDPEEQSIKQEEEHLTVCVPESGAVKTEESSLLQQTEHKEEETQEEDISAEPHLHSESEGETEHFSYNDEDWKAPIIYSDDGDDYDQVQIRARSTAAKNTGLSPKQKSAPETSVLDLTPLVTVGTYKNRQGSRSQKKNTTSSRIHSQEKNHQSSSMAESLRNGFFWKKDETVLMLTLLKELNILEYMDGRKTRNGNLFKKVAEQLREGGFTRTPWQIRIRWKHLKKTYYLARKNDTTSGRDRVVCPFGDELEELLGPRTLSPVDHHDVDDGFESALGTSQRPPGRRHNVAHIDTLLGRMERMEAAWILQSQQSQEREERMVNSILDSNARMVSAVMEGIRGFQQSMQMEPPSRLTGFG